MPKLNQDRELVINNCESTFGLSMYIPTFRQFAFTNLPPRCRTVNACSSCAKGLESNFGPAKSYTSLQMVRHRFNIYAWIAVLPWCYDVEMGTANLLYARRITASIMKGLVLVFINLHFYCGRQAQEQFSHEQFYFNTSITK